MSKTIRVIIAEDSQSATLLLRSILDAAPDIEVIACARDGNEAVELTKQLKPDLVTMDIYMPNMDGVSATQTIMNQCPTPILVISSHANDSESDMMFHALQAGALSIIEKPKGLLDEEGQRLVVKSVRIFSEVHVTRRRASPIPEKPVISHNCLRAKIFALGTSTGGPAALRTIFSSLPESFPMPIVVVQHITKGFLPGLIKWLQNTSKLKLQIAKNKQALVPGYVYFAEDDSHLIIEKQDTPIAISDYSAPIDHFRPSINALLSSIATSYPDAAIGGILTGMGRDGAEGLLKMKQAGCVTFAQSQATSIIYGMPAVAVSLNAQQYSVDLEQIPQFLTTVINNGRRIE